MFNDNNVARLIDIANVACHKGKVLEARNLYDAILAFKPNFVPARLGYAFTHIVLNEFTEAIERLELILDENPMDEDAISWMGLIAFLLDDKVKAREILEPLANSEQEHVRVFVKEIMSA